MWLRGDGLEEGDEIGKKKLGERGGCCERFVVVCCEGGEAEVEGSCFFSSMVARRVAAGMKEMMS